MESIRGGGGREKQGGGGGGGGGRAGVKQMEMRRG